MHFFIVTSLSRVKRDLGSAKANVNGNKMFTVLYQIANIGDGELSFT